MADPDARAVTEALGGRWHGSYGTACCPAHEDRTPSLSLRDGRDGRLLAYCHATCDWPEIADALRARGLLPGRGRGSAANDPAARASRERAAREEAQRRARQARLCWTGTRHIARSPAAAYLRSRGITGFAEPAGRGGPLPRTLRYHPACWHAPTARRRPAMVALVEGAGASAADGVPSVDGAPSFAVHRTYLTREGRKIAPAGDAKLMLGATLGGAVRLREARQGCDVLVVAEGIETALSVALGAAGPIPAAAAVWAALSAPGLAGLVLPPRTGRSRRPGRLIVAADGDPAGWQAAEALASRAREAGWSVALRTAPEGQDWNDVLRAGIPAPRKDRMEARP